MLLRQLEQTTVALLYAPKIGYCVCVICRQCSIFSALSSVFALSFSSFLLVVSSFSEKQQQIRTLVKQAILLHQYIDPYARCLERVFINRLS